MLKHPTDAKRILIELQQERKLEYAFWWLQAHIAHGYLTKIEDEDKTELLIAILDADEAVAVEKQRDISGHKSILGITGDRWITIDGFIHNIAESITQKETYVCTVIETTVSFYRASSIILEPKAQGLSQESIESLRSVWVGRVSRAAEDETLIGKKGLVSILSRWRDWRIKKERAQLFPTDVLNRYNIKEILGLVDALVNTQEPNRASLNQYVDITELNRIIGELDESRLSSDQADVARQYKEAIL